MNITKKQHYVSQGILKHFLNEQGKVFELLIEKKLILNYSWDNSINC